MTPISSYGNQQIGPSEAVSPSDGSRATTGSPEAKLWEQCCQFEGVFLSLVVAQMRQTVDDQGGLFAASSGRRMMQSMMDDAMVTAATQTGRAGLATKLYADFRRHGLMPATDERKLNVSA